MSNTGTDLSSGVSTGIGAGLAIGIGMRNEEEAKQRRLSNMGKDQILIETKMSADAIGNVISGIWKNWYYNDGKIYQKRSIPFSGFAFAVISFCIGIGLFLFWFFFALVMDLDLVKSLPWTPINGLIVSIVVGIIFGIWVGSQDEEIDYIRITKLKNTIAVLIKIYDSNGYRNIDDDKILEISEQIKPIDNRVD